MEQGAEFLFSKPLQLFNRVVMTGEREDHQFCTFPTFSRDVGDAKNQRTHDFCRITVQF